MPRPLYVLIVACLLSPIVCLGAEPVLTYERVHSQVAHYDNTFRLVVFDDQHAEAHFPFYSPQAGTYRWKLTEAEMAALLELAEPLRSIRSASLASDIEQRAAQALSAVTDPDRVTISLSDSSRGTHRVVAPSPEIWAENMPDGHELNTVADVAERIAAWTRDNAREMPR